MISVFVSYSHKDEELQNQLQVHLSMLKRQGVIDVWHDRRIVHGDEIDSSVSEALEEAQVVLLLVSPDFLASDYCYDREMQRAMERHEAGEARVLPVILRPCDWTDAPFGKLLATPKDGKPVVTWANIDEAFLDVTQAIRCAVDVTVKDVPEAEAVSSAAGGTAPMVAGPRSSNLRVRQAFTEADKDLFLDEAFEYIARFFQNSLTELEKRNTEIKTAFKRIDARRFTSVIYQDGKAVSRCQVFLGGFGGGTDSIMYSMNDTPSDNSYNECLTVEEGDQMLGLRPMMNIHAHSDDRQVMTHEGAAEHYWSLLIERLQR